MGEIAQAGEVMTTEEATAIILEEGTLASSRFEDKTTTEEKIKNDEVTKIQPLRGGIKPLSLEGGKEPLAIIIEKINEIVDIINDTPQ